MTKETTPLFVKVSSKDRVSNSDDSSSERNRRCKQVNGFLFPSSYLCQLIAGTLALTVVALVLNHTSSSSDDAISQQPTHVRYDQRHSTTSFSIPKTITASVKKYTQVQGIGFQIYTGGAPAFLNDTVPNPECTTSYGQVAVAEDDDDTMELQCYLGDRDPMVDVEQRMQIMRAAVEAAYAATDHTDPSTLKVFIAPEFFWRGIDGAYAFADEKIRNDLVCGPICKILRDLQAYVADPRFEHWFFVFGTVVAYDVLPTEDTYDYLFYNFAPVYKGYDPKKNSHAGRGRRFLLPKRYVSSSDFLTPRRNLNTTVFQELIGDDAAFQTVDSTVRNPFAYAQKRYNDALWRDYKREVEELGYTMIEYDWLVVDGLSISLEICFDHQMRTALNTYLGDMVTGRHTFIPSTSDDDHGISYTQIPTHQADISIVSSAGMTITADSLALVNHGVAFLQDGLSDAPQRTTLQPDGPEFMGGTEGLRRSVVLTPTDVSFAYEWLPAPRSIHVPIDASAEGVVFSRQKYPPRVNIYDPVDIAKVKEQQQLEPEP